VIPSFAELGVPAELVARLTKHGIDVPFPIQAATLPEALAGRDVCGRAPTGSGKTLAFGLALVARCSPARPHHPTALVLVPTRELAAQVENELAWLGRGNNVSTVTIYGGVSYQPQRKALAKGVDVVIACPGRLEDLIAAGSLDLDKVEIVVLDEADRMADMGFVPAVRRLLDRTPDNRQTLLFSATLDGEVNDLVKRYQRNPVRHDVVGSEADSGEVSHHFWHVERSDRISVIRSLVGAQGRSIVFCRTKRGADRVAKQLNAVGLGAVPLHGDRSQAQRDRALAAFTSGSAQALIATDVAARGIHVDEVSCVVHYDPAGDAKDYVHRSGRTGRAGADGIVVTLVSDEVKKEVKALQKALSLPQRVELAPRLDAMPAGSFSMSAAPPARGRDRDRDRDRDREVATVATIAKPRRGERPLHAAKANGSPKPKPARGERKHRGPEPHEPAPKPKSKTSGVAKFKADEAKSNGAKSNGAKSSGKTPIGTVKFFDVKKGYGFIARDGHDDVFVHTSAVVSSGLRRLETGQKVTFDLEPGRNGHEAANLRLL
jgi:superfamily II DNA/RNA helicase